MQLKKINVFFFIFLVFLWTGCMRSYDLRFYSTNGSLYKKWGDYSIKISLDSYCESHRNFLILSKKKICKEPYVLRLDMWRENDFDTNKYVLINFAEVVYSSGEKIILKNNHRPRKILFKDKKHIRYIFETPLLQKHKKGQKLNCKISLTLMPENNSKIFHDSLYGDRKKYSVGFWEQIQGI